MRLAYHDALIVWRTIKRFSAFNQRISVSDF
jgi:hypothetical protein